MQLIPTAKAVIKIKAKARQNAPTAIREAPTKNNFSVRIL
jgi:hypothetical protein